MVGVVASRACPPTPWCFAWSGLWSIPSTSSRQGERQCGSVIAAAGNVCMGRWEHWTAQGTQSGDERTVCRRPYGNVAEHISYVAVVQLLRFADRLCTIHVANSMLVDGCQAASRGHGALKCIRQDAGFPSLLWRSCWRHISRQHADTNEAVAVARAPRKIDRRMAVGHKARGLEGLVSAPCAHRAGARCWPVFQATGHSIRAPSCSQAAAVGAAFGCMTGVLVKHAVRLPRSHAACAVAPLAPSRQTCNVRTTVRSFCICLSLSCIVAYT